MRDENSAGTSVVGIMSFAVPLGNPQGQTRADAQGYRPRGAGQQRRLFVN
jgi:hypothetical protein